MNRENLLLYNSFAFMVALSYFRAIALTVVLLFPLMGSGLALIAQFPLQIFLFILLSQISLLTYLLITANSNKPHTVNPEIRSTIGKGFGSAFLGSGMASTFTSQNKVIHHGK